MPQGLSVSAYPWGSLEQMSRSTARRWGVLQRRFSGDSIADKLALAIERWLGAPVRVERRGLRAMPAEPAGPSTRWRLRLPAGTGEIIVCVDTRLTTRLVNFALNRDTALHDPLTNLEPSLLGAASAIAVKIIDDAALNLDVEFSFLPLEIADAQRLQLDATLHIGTTAYPLVLGFVLNWLPERPSAAELSALGPIELSLPLVIGETRLLREQLARIAPGTALVTGSGLWVDDSLVGHAALIAPLADSGKPVQLQPGGKIVLGEGSVTLNHDNPNSTQTSDTHSADLTDTLFEAPVVVRVELGTVSLPARQWAQLRPGDIVETSQPLGAEVTLRVAGQALAKGELLNVEGELGVRITKMLVGEEP